MHRHHAKLAPHDVLEMARGFSELFWGIGLSLLLATEFVNLRGIFTPYFPAYLLGLLLTLAGSFRLSKIQVRYSAWTHHSKYLLCATLIFLIMAPFIGWWRAAPDLSYYTVNMIILSGVVLSFFITAHNLVEETAKLLDQPLLRAETKYCRAATLACSAIPLLLLFYHFFRHDSEKEVNAAMSLLEKSSSPTWILASFVFPFLLTMAIVWEGRQHCLLRLRQDNH